MITRTLSLSFAALLAAAGSAHSQAPSTEELASALRGLLLTHLPTPLAHAEPNWGKQVEAIVGKNRNGSPKMRNHGVWRKVRITAISPEKTLQLHIRNVQQLDDRRTVFDLVIELDAQFDLEQQIWERGIRVYAGSSQARAKVSAAVTCEVTTRVDSKKGLFPDLIFTVGVTKADLRYRDLDFVRIGRIGGDGADVIGHALHDTLTTLRPSLEKDLLAKANAAIVKAGQAKEVRLSLSKLIKS